MGRSDTTVFTFECDAKCGAIEEVSSKAASSLNHAHVPQGWEKLYRVPTGYMTTDADSAKVPYVLCPKCYRIFEILVMGDKTGVGCRFRTFVKAFWDNEKEMERITNEFHGTGVGGSGGGGGGGR